MSNLLDKVLLAGLGLEHKVKEKIDELAKEGQKEADEEGLGAKEEVENKLVENIVEVVGSALKKVGVAKSEVDQVLASLAENLAERMKIVTVDDLDILEKLVMGNREKILQLEKKVKQLEAAAEKPAKGEKKATDKD